MNGNANKEIGIRGISYPSDKRDKKLNAKKVSLFRPMQFIWLGIVVLFGILAVMFGTPHLRFKYQYEGSRSHPYYLSCQYAGINSQRIIPHDGKCPLVRLFRFTSIGE